MSTDNGIFSLMERLNNEINAAIAVSVAAGEPRGSQALANVLNEVGCKLCAALAAPEQVLPNEDEARKAFWGCYPGTGNGDTSDVWMTCYRWCRAMLSAAPPSPQPEQAPVTKQWCQEHPASAAYIINTLAARLDAQPEPATFETLLAQLDTIRQQTLANPGKAVPLPPLVADEGRKFMRGEPSLFDRIPLGDVASAAAVVASAQPEPASRPDSLRCAGCDISNGCPEYCRCGNQPEPAAQAPAEPAAPYLSVLKRLRGIAHGVSMYGAPDQELLARRIDGIADELAAYGATLIAEDAGVEPAPARVALKEAEQNAKRWEYVMDWATKDFAVCMRHGTSWSPIKTSGPVDHAMSALNQTTKGQG